MVNNPSELAFLLGFLLVIAFLSGMITDALQSRREIGPWFRVRLHTTALLWAGLYFCLLAPITLGGYLHLQFWLRIAIFCLVAANGVIMAILARTRVPGQSPESKS